MRGRGLWICTIHTKCKNLSSEIPLSKLNERWPVRCGSMPAWMLAKGDVSVNQSCFRRREGCGAEVTCPEEFVYRSCCDTSEEHSFLIYPFITFQSTANKYRTRCAQSNQFVCIYGKVIPIQRASIFDEVARNPMIFAWRSYILNKFTCVSTM